jgi:hypothetical protein
MATISGDAKEQQEKNQVSLNQMYKELYGNIENSLKSEYPIKEGIIGSNDQKSSVGPPGIGNTTIQSAFGRKTSATHFH